MTAKVAVVTGAARGIGAAIASQLASSGFDVALLSQESEASAHAAIDAVRKRGRSAIYCEHDIARLEQHGAIVERIQRELGHVDCLVNNAGVSSLVRGDMLDLGVESFDRSFGVNVRGTFFLTQAFARSMLGRGDEGSVPYRSIITITSANARLIGLNRADYCMSKAALSMMSSLWAARLAASGIHVFEVRPGIIRTDMTAPAAAKYDDFIANEGVPMRRWGEPGDVAAAVATIAEGGMSFTTGEVINVGGGLHLHRL